MTMLDTGAWVDVPAMWPASLHPRHLATLDLPTPYLLGDTQLVRDRLRAFASALPGVTPFYAIKCNSDPTVLRAVASEGAGFEIASLGELAMLQAVGVDPRDVLYSNTVKPAAHVRGAFEAGVWRFAVDSEGELDKIARCAPGSAVYVRVRVDDSGSIFPLSRKFGAESHHARALLQQAKHLGLQPYGVTFHVGSQCSATSAWVQALSSVGRLMRQLAQDQIMLEMVNIGGGFPARYGEPVPSIEEIGAVIGRSVEQLLPYRPVLLAAEPGRHIVAETAVMVAEVLGREVRAGEDWLYLDVGAYNGLMETQQTVGQWRFPLWSSRADHGAVEQVPFTVTGPSCDSSDTMFFGALLPVTMGEGDRIYVASAGAYTLSYASHFNGFPPPATHFVG